MKLAAFIAWLSLFLVACGRDACPPRLTAVVDPEHSGIVWGGDPPKITATLKRVAAECVREELPAVEAGGVKRGATVTYSLDATAQIDYAVRDTAYLRTATIAGDLFGTVIFEASTDNGVVLGSHTGTFSVILGGSSASASAKISGLSAAEAARVKFVAARWQYGRGY